MEAGRLGYEQIIMPQKSAEKIRTSGIRVIGVKTLRDALAASRG